jgi:hypothetical protein
MPWTPSVADIALDPPPVLDNVIALRGFRIETPRVRSGATTRVVLFWTAEARPTSDLTTFVHLLLGNAEFGGERVAQRDVQPVGGSRPTGSWRSGDFIGDAYDVVIPAGTPPGLYRLVVGMYDLATMRRVPARPGVQATAGSSRATPVAGMASVRAGAPHPWPGDSDETPLPGTIDGEDRITLGTITVE